jgi:anaerobic selenocysteine-containing dehydrogenase
MVTGQRTNGPTAAGMDAAGRLRYAPAMRLRTACNRDCPDACSIVATVENDRVVRIQGDKDHPVTRGFLCHRTSHFLERQYHPERLTTPLYRRGGALTPVSWDEALDIAASALVRICSESGPAAILHYRSGGTLGLMKHLCDYFFERFGPTAMKTGDICSGAGDAAQMTDFGDEDSSDLFDLLNSRTIILWGKNPHVSNVHLLPVLKQAGDRGARLVLVDPVHHRGVDLCELYVQPRPGGDIALIFGVARLLFERGATDPAAASYCDHLDDFRAQAMSRGVADWAALADVRPDELEALAALYGQGPSAILVGWGMQRKAQGSATVRMLDALCAISGNLGVRGGGVSFYFKRRGAFDLSFIRGERAAPRLVPEPRLGAAILEARDPEIRMVWVTAGNPVVMLPESLAVKRALETRELTVVVDQFLTDTARAAHLVLPTTTMLEDEDLVGAYGHHWLGEVRPVAQRPAGVKTDYEIMQELARRVGLGEEPGKEPGKESDFALSAEDWKRRLLSKVAPRGASLESIRDQRVRNPLAPEVLFADRKFPTATGRVNLIHDVAIDAGVPGPGQARPLFLMALSTDKSQASQWAESSTGLPDGHMAATVHPEAAPGFSDGDLAVVESAIASMTVRLRFDARQRRDVLLVAKGGWLASGQCANALVPAQLTDAGGGAVYYDTPVRLRPVEAHASGHVDAVGYKAAHKAR